ncbi:MAG: PTS galactitol transporter subunit IIC [Cellulosilyticaceae bacterium]
MSIVREFINSLLAFQSYVLLPVIMLVLCLVTGMKVTKALKHALTLGIGFIGIFMTFDYFVVKLSPVLTSIIERTGMEKSVLDVGWPPFAAMAWEFKLAPILIFLFLGVNIIMLILKSTQTINIDIWNYWHFIFTAQMVFFMTANIWAAIGAGVFLFIICQKLADWTAVEVEKYAKMPRVAITTLSGLAYYPCALLVHNLIDKIPKVRDIEADPESIQKKIGICGEPMFIGLFMGIGLGIAAGYDYRQVLELAVNMAAVVYILPKMSGILGEGLIPICDNMKQYMFIKFPSMKETYIGMDMAILMGNPAVIVTGILFIPINVLLALILPGINFIPLGDLPNMIGYAIMIVVACRGNVFRAFIAGIPTIIAKLYIASYMAGEYTQIAKELGMNIGGHKGEITGFLDGGNVMRFWVIQLFSGGNIGFILTPILVGIIYYLYQKKKEF